MTEKELNLEEEILNATKTILQKILEKEFVK